jgi:hypothetical protein
MTIQELLNMMIALNPEWVIHNAPRNPHKYRGLPKGLAICMPRAYLMHSNPSLTVGEVLEIINNGATVYGIPFDQSVYVVESMHNAGSPLVGLLLTPNGVRLVWE